MTNYDNNTNTDSVKDNENDADDAIEYDNDTETENNTQKDRDDKGMSYAQWSTETHENDNAHVKAYDNMIREIEDAQNAEYYKAQRQIQNALVNDTPVKTKDNKQYIDNISVYDRDVQFQSQFIIG